MRALALVALLVVGSAPAADDLRYDARAAAFYRIMHGPGGKAARTCMRNLTRRALEIGRRDSERIIEANLKLCGVPLYLALVDAGVDPEKAAEAVVRMSEHAVIYAPGVKP
jgi:hypothetical protein